MYLIGHRSNPGTGQSFGDKAGIHALLTCTACVAAVDHGEVGRHVLTSNVFPGGYNIIFYDTAVEEEIRATIGELASGQGDFLFATLTPDAVPVEETALLVWRCESYASDLVSLAKSTIDPALRATRRARVVALCACCVQLRFMAGVSEAASKGDSESNLADAAANAVEDEVDAAKAAQASAVTLADQDNAAILDH